MAAAGRCSGTHHRSTDRPIHYDCRRQRQLDIKGVLFTIRGRFSRNPLAVTSGAERTSGSLKKPNLFIVGAPRCGTTTLWSQLKEHPEIFMSREKELYFFDSDLRAKHAPTEIKSFSPEARIIIMLRNPLDVMYSLHAQVCATAQNPSGALNSRFEADKKREGIESLRWR
jgi:hypothetical protein